MFVYGVFVLGELGRSPRMQYHTLSLSEIPGSQVHAFGLSGAQVHPQIAQRENVHLHLLSDALWNWLPARSALQSSILKLLWFLCIAPLKVMLQCAVILAYLIWNLPNHANYLIVQNPPSIPTLLLVQIVCMVFKRQCKLVVDWHNFGYSLLDVSGPREVEAKSGSERLIVRVARWIEITFGRHAHHHFCVSEAMRQMLLEKWGINATVLYDRPPSMFRELTLMEKHELYGRIFGTESTIHSSRYHDDDDDDDGYSYSSTLFTTCRTDSVKETGEKKGHVTLRDDRPALIVSSTSWTPDEDFQILLDAVESIERTLQSNDNDGSLSNFPRLEFVITGRGPQKEMYERKIAAMQLRNCNIRTAWLRAEDYPMLLASSDLGLCFHFSSSGVDLPMKVVDMFGSALPVCAIGYKTLPELVLHGENGYIFRNSDELAKFMMALFRDFPNDTATLDRFRNHLRQHFQTHRWDDEWNAKAHLVFTRSNTSRQVAQSKKDQ